MSNVSIGPTGVVHLEARKFETAAEWMALGNELFAIMEGQS